MTNPFFNKWHFIPEQNLLQDLIVEAVSIAGIETFYVPRNIGNYDKLYQTDDQSTYTKAIPLDVYLESIDGFEGQQNIFGKFGLEIRDQITITIPYRSFQQFVQPITNTDRPMEGDIVFFFLNKKCFQIKFVNNKEIFFAFGQLPTFKCTCELFEYSNETFNTGVPEIDSIQKLSLNAFDSAVTDESGDILTDESGNAIVDETYDPQNVDVTFDTDFFNSKFNTLIDNNETNPIANISGA